jgi:hypothetical protein
VNIRQKLPCVNNSRKPSSALPLNERNVGLNDKKSIDDNEHFTIRKEEILKIFLGFINATVTTLGTVIFSINK